MKTINTDEIKYHILKWLETYDWLNQPDPDNFVMANLELIFVHLIGLGLCVPEMWNAFRQAAVKKYNEALQKQQRTTAP